MTTAVSNILPYAVNDTASPQSSTPRTLADGVSETLMLVEGAGVDRIAIQLLRTGDTPITVGWLEDQGFDQGKAKPITGPCKYIVTRMPGARGGVDVCATSS